MMGRRVFILGAGASAHAGYPLTAGLGAAVVGWAEKNPRDDLPSRLTKEDLEREFPPGCDVEAVVTKLAESGRTQFLGHLREMICEYFDSIAIKRNTVLYERFAKSSVSSGDVVITFNYDVSLEFALREAGKWDIGDGYGFRIEGNAPTRSHVRVLKLHGSTSWLDLVVPSGFPGVFQKSTPDLEGYGFRPQILPQYFEMFGYGSDVRDPQLVGGAAVRDGSMILPTREKRFKIRKDFWDGLWHQAEEALRMASQIVVVGYSMPPADERARKLIFGSRKEASVLCCCRGDNHRLVKEFHSEGFANVSGDFSDFESWLAHDERNHRSTTM